MDSDKANPFRYISSDQNRSDLRKMQLIPTPNLAQVDHQATPSFLFLFLFLQNLHSMYSILVLLNWNPLDARALTKFLTWH